MGRGGATEPPVHASDQFAPARPLSNEVPPPFPSPRPLPKAPAGGKADDVDEDTGLNPRLLFGGGGGAVAGGDFASKLSAERGAPRPSPKASVALVVLVEVGG